jgi:hypothetical protein
VQAVPVRPLDPGLTEELVPTELGRDIPPPPELQDMLDLLRDAPVKWFVYVPAILERFDKLDILQRTFLNAKTRAQVSFAVPVKRAVIAAGTFGASLSKVIAAQEQVLARERLVRTQIDLTAAASLSWLHANDEAKSVLSLGDLIDSSHGRSQVAQRAAREFADITAVATGLYSMFGEVVPVIRLEWAQRLSQFDDPVNLRNLASLPRWGEIEFADRRAMQTMVDWLFQRINAREPDAVALMNDVVRVCILLASHAPINEIITGRLPRPATATVGAHIDISVLTQHIPKVRIGMHALLYAGPAVVAKAVVEDISGGQAVARVIQASA